MHEGHRQRLRDMYLQNGLHAMPPHMVLELLLCYAIHRKDTNPIAHRLIDTFGSLNAVFDAPVEELIKVEGVGEYAASLIKLIPQLHAKLIEENNDKAICYSDKEKFMEYAASCFTGEKNEVFLIFSMNNNGSVLKCNKISTGTKHSVHYDNRTILETVFRDGATTVVLAHNHPAGVAAPSKEDVNYTIELIDLFKSVDIRVLDHIIVSSRDVFSMASSPKFNLYFLM